MKLNITHSLGLALNAFIAGLAFAQELYWVLPINIFGVVVAMGAQLLNRTRAFYEGRSHDDTQSWRNR